jgi:hypothetical protein
MRNPIGVFRFSCDPTEEASATLCRLEPAKRIALQGVLQHKLGDMRHTLPLILSFSPRIQSSSVSLLDPTAASCESSRQIPTIMNQRVASVGTAVAIQASEVEVVSHTEIVSRCQDIELNKAVASVSTELAELGIDDICRSIQSFASLAKENRKKARLHAAFAIIYAWGCGRSLNHAKSMLEHGKFKDWLLTTVCNTEFSESTAGRFMRLAKNHPDLKTLLISSASLRQAYIATGILKPFSNSEEQKEEKTSITNAPVLDRLFQAKQEFLKLNEERVLVGEETREKIAIALAELEELFVEMIEVNPAGG